MTNSEKKDEQKKPSQTPAEPVETKQPKTSNRAAKAEKPADLRLDWQVIGTLIESNINWDLPDNPRTGRVAARFVVKAIRDQHKEAN